MILIKFQVFKLDNTRDFKVIYQIFYIKNIIIVTAGLFLIISPVEGFMLAKVLRVLNNK